MEEQYFRGWFVCHRTCLFDLLAIGADRREEERRGEGATTDSVLLFHYDN